MGETTKYDVAVLGLWWSSNYGSIMTYYSLYRLIESYGYRTVIIDLSLIHIWCFAWMTVPQTILWKSSANM